MQQIPQQNPYMQQPMYGGFQQPVYNPYSPISKVVKFLPSIGELNINGKIASKSSENEWNTNLSLNLVFNKVPSTYSLRFKLNKLNPDLSGLILGFTKDLTKSTLGHIGANVIGFSCSNEYAYRSTVLIRGYRVQVGSEIKVVLDPSKLKASWYVNNDNVSES